jgi:hypothetical protein
MRTVTTTGVVRADHTLTVAVPPDIPPGPRTVVVVLDDAVAPRSTPAAMELTPHPVGPTDAACTYRREDLYGDDGR